MRWQNGRECLLFSWIRTNIYFLQYINTNISLITVKICGLSVDWCYKRNHWECIYLSKTYKIWTMATRVNRKPTQMSIQFSKPLNNIQKIGDKNSYMLSGVHWRTGDNLTVHSLMAGHFLNKCKIMIYSKILPI